LTDSERTAHEDLVNRLGDTALWKRLG
jgi:hypothetical protein